MAILLVAVLVHPAQEPELPRRAEWGATFGGMGDSGVTVRQVVMESPATRAGLRAGDLVVRLQTEPVSTLESFQRAVRGVRGGDSVRLVVRRGIDAISLSFVLRPVPLETIADVRLEYGSVRVAAGYRVRTVVTRPQTAEGRLPAVLFIPWLSCDPVEKPDPGNDGFAHMLRAVAAGSGMMTMRVEKPGVGDSEGPRCGDTTLEDDLGAFRAALASLRTRPDVDTAHLYLLGGSIGGALAPILAAENPRGLRGVISVGGFTKTWYEHMLEIERRRLDLSGNAPEQVNASMRGFARFYTEYLIGRRTPAQVLASNPDLRPIWYDEPTRQYGRRAEYYHSVQQLNVEKAWADVAAAGIPALIVWGEYDWIMGRGDQERAVELVRRSRPEGATLVVLPGTDHGLMRYASQQAAFADENPVHDGAAAAVINRWLRAREATGREPRP